MRSKWINSFIVASSFLISTSAFALDPVAPKSYRAFGQLIVHTPLPESDQCTVISKQGASQSCKPEEILKLPIGEYTVKVTLQNNEWTRDVSLEPTERTDVFVTGYGNLKVTTPNPSSDVVEVYSTSGEKIRSFPASKIQTLPVGDYEVRMTVGKLQVTQEVTIVTNTTREVSISY